MREALSWHKALGFVGFLGSISLLVHTHGGIFLVRVELSRYLLLLIAVNTVIDAAD